MTQNFKISINFYNVTDKAILKGSTFLNDSNKDFDVF